MSTGGQDIDSAVFDAQDTGLIVLDADGRVTKWNAWMAAASAVTPDSARDRTLQEIFPHLPLLSRLASAVSAALSLGASSILTHSLHPLLLGLKTRTGRDLVHDISLRPLGHPPNLSCLVQVVDVTAASQREKVLRERQNARYDAVVNSAADAILTIDESGKIQLANPAAASELGYSANALIGKPVGSLFEDEAYWEQVWQEVLVHDTLYRPVELVACRHDGSRSYLEVSAAAWSAEGRRFVTAILRDVNERRAAEAALRSLNETLEERVAAALEDRRVLANIVETTDAFIQVMAPDFSFLAVNNASATEFERVFGVRPRVGDNVLDLLADHPVEQDNVRALWARALAGEEFTIVHEFGDSTRDRRHYELKFNVLRDGAGKQVGAYQFVYDVTDRVERQAQLVRTEDALRQAQKMEAIGQLTGGIAHDFNNLLTGIIGAMDLLKSRIAAGRYEDTQRFLDAATTSASRAAALTHRLLAFARRQPLDPKGVEANPLVRGMEELFHRTLAERAKLSIDLQADLWPALTDANQLENALLNLVINARDAMPEGGRITIETRNVTQRAQVTDGQESIEPGDYAVISVRDTGVGMSPDILAKVFDPFFTTKPLGQGTGLGLSMIYGFAKQSRGHVRIASEIGRGTTVSLYLPRFTGELATDVPVSTASLLPGSGETVMLVEDDSSVRLLIGEVLRELGYICLEAIDGQAAMPVLTSNARIDLLITDVGLPGINGRQLAEIARQHRPGLKVLFVTGYAEHATGDRRFLEPGMEMVTKPFALDALALKIRDILAPRR